MNVLHWLQSPLAGTAGVLTALGLLAIPLRHLTSATPVNLPQQAASMPAVGVATPAVLRLKLLARASRIRITTADAKVLLDLSNIAAGESEHDALLPLHDGNLDLVLEADLGAGSADTAVFLTIMPDAYEGQTRYVIGSGVLDEALHYNWHDH
jgi:hypothetical protein